MLSKVATISALLLAFQAKQVIAAPAAVATTPEVGDEIVYHEDTSDIGQTRTQIIWGSDGGFISVTYVANPTTVETVPARTIAEQIYPEILITNPATTETFSGFTQTPYTISQTIITESDTTLTIPPFTDTGYIIPMTIVTKSLTTQTIHAETESATTLSGYVHLEDQTAVEVVTNGVTSTVTVRDIFEITV